MRVRYSTLLNVHDVDRIAILALFARFSHRHGTLAIGAHLPHSLNSAHLARNRRVFVGILRSNDARRRALYLRSPKITRFSCISQDLWRIAVARILVFLPDGHHLTSV